MNYKLLIFTLLALLCPLYAEAQSGFDVLVRARNGLLPRTANKARVFFYNPAGDPVNARLRTDSTGRTRIEAYWFKPGDTVRVGVEPVSKKGRFCKNNEKIYRLKTEKIMVIPAENSTVAIRLKRKFNPLYDLTDIGTGALLSFSLFATLKSRQIHDDYWADFALPNREQVYQNANQWNHAAIATFYTAIALQTTRYLLFCRCNCMKKRPAAASRVNLLLKSENLGGIPGVGAGITYTF